MTARAARRIGSPLWVAGALITVLAGCRASRAAPSPSGSPAPREVTLDGVPFIRDQSILRWSPEQQRVGYGNAQFLWPSRIIMRGRSVSPLPTQSLDLSGFTYVYEGRAQTLDDFITQTNVVGLLVLKDGKVVLERYAHGHGPRSPWYSFSVTKSVVSMLFGAALADGSIRSLDDSITRYVGALRGSAYDAVTIRQLLRMSSGVAWNEDYADSTSDIAQHERLGRAGGIDSLLAYMKRLPRKAAPGTVFNYNTVETDIAGAVLHAATGRSLSLYLSEKIWQPAGMEADASWRLLREGDYEFGGCCISATLRDYGRLGLLALRDGVTADGRRLFPEGWMAASTTPSPTNPSYGNYWWLTPSGRYYATGIYGQHISVDPARQMVIAIQSYWPQATSRELSAQRTAFLEGMGREVDARRTH